MKLKWVVLTVLTGVVVLTDGVFAAAVNEASFINEDWDNMRVNAGGNGPKIGWTADPGGKVSANNGELTISMEGTADGAANVTTVRLEEFSDKGLFPAKYIVTTRTKVQQFPDISFAKNTWPPQGIVLADIRRGKRLIVALTPSTVWINSGSTWTSVPANTKEGAYYTWQFEVDDTKGTVDVFRRENEAEDFVGLATDVVIRSQDVADMIYCGTVFYNDKNERKQGVLIVDSFQVGKAGM